MSLPPLSSWCLCFPVSSLGPPQTLQPLSPQRALPLCSDYLGIRPHSGGHPGPSQGGCPAWHPPGQALVESLLCSPASRSSRRGSFLVLLLRECFRDLGWLATIHGIGGEVGLLVTSIVPQTPFFWAMHVTEVRACCGPVGPPGDGGRVRGTHPEWPHSWSQSHSRPSCLPSPWGSSAVLMG